MRTAFSQARCQQLAGNTVDTRVADQFAAARFPRAAPSPPLIYRLLPARARPRASAGLSLAARFTGPVMAEYSRCGSSLTGDRLLNGTSSLGADAPEASCEAIYDLEAEQPERQSEAAAEAAGDDDLGGQAFDGEVSGYFPPQFQFAARIRIQERRARIRANCACTNPGEELCREGCLCRHAHLEDRRAAVSS
jgi:hypothetical protein